VPMRCASKHALSLRRMSPLPAQGAAECMPRVVLSYPSYGWRRVLRRPRNQYRGQRLLIVIVEDAPAPITLRATGCRDTGTGSPHDMHATGFPSKWRPREREPRAR
jgi:hypothetical protein